MRIGLFVDDAGATLDQISRQVQAAGQAGFATVWTGERGLWDPLTLFAALGGRSPGSQGPGNRATGEQAPREQAPGEQLSEGQAVGGQQDGPALGTAVVRTHPRHPLALAAQALTTQAATGNRLLLGIGPSHAPIVEGQYGSSYASPVANLREYLSVLRPLLRGEEVDFRGRFWTAAGSVSVPGAKPPPVFLAALGPRMLQLAGELADGTVTTWAGPRSVEGYFLPALARAAEAAGRPTPAVIAGVCVCVTDDPDGARRWIDDRYGMARNLPAYRAVFDREGADGPGDVLVAGDEEAVGRELRRFADAGVTEVQVIACGSEAEQARTVAFAAELARSAASTL